MRTIDGSAPDAVLVAAVRARDSTAERISYLTVGNSVGIPDPSPDRAVVEFDTNGITCTADVSGLADDEPVVDVPSCDDVGLTTSGPPRK